MSKNILYENIINRTVDNYVRPSEQLSEAIEYVNLQDSELDVFKILTSTEMIATIITTGKESVDNVLTKLLSIVFEEKKKEFGKYKKQIIESLKKGYERSLEVYDNLEIQKPNLVKDAAEGIEATKILYKKYRIKV